MEVGFTDINVGKAEGGLEGNEEGKKDGPPVG